MAATRSSTHSNASSLCKTEEATEIMEKKKIDSHVLFIILEHVGELYTERKGLLKKMFDGSKSQSHHDNTLEALKKLKEEVIQVRLSKRDVKVVTRSLSVGSLRRSPADNVTRLDRFKIRTLDVKQGGGGGGPQLGGSK